MTDYDPVKPIRNWKSFAKYALFYFEPCASAFLQTYRWLYERDGPPENIIDHYNSFHKDTKNKFNKGDKTKLEDIKNNPSKIKEFDITLLYKLIQYGTGNDELASPNDNVWSKNCPLADADKLEHLLFLVKEGRNKVGHVEDSLKNLTDNDVIDECNNLIGRLSSIIQQSGEMASIDQAIIDNVKKGIKEDLERIRDKKEGPLTDLPTLLKFIKQDMVSLHEKDLERSFENELRGYCPPNFIRKSDQSFRSWQSYCTTKDLLSSLQSQILIVDGQSGMGKTSFTKYLFRCWLLDETEELDLSSYEVIFRIDCRSIPTSDIYQFLEGHLPYAQHYLSNTESLKKHLKELKVLWIMDGFDESTPEFRRFLTSIQTNLSSEHKIVITTRPDCLNELKKKFPKNAIEATLENFTIDQVYEGTAKYLKDKNKIDEFHQFYKNLSDETQTLMKTPGNLNLCLDIWTHDSDELKGELTMHKLYEKILRMQINQLVERHRDKTKNVNEDNLKLRVEKWFYDVLCKIAAKSFISIQFTIGNREQKLLEDEARNLCLLENYCLSTFLNAEQSHKRGLRYVYRHRTQQEVLASLYLRKSKDDKILELLQGFDANAAEIYLECKIDILKKTCNGKDLVRISDLFLDQSRFMEDRYFIQGIWCDIFKEAKGDEEFRKAFRTKVSSWPKPFLYVASHYKLDLVNLENLIDCLLPDVREFDIHLSLDYFPTFIRYRYSEEYANRAEEDCKASLEEALRNLIKVFETYGKITFGLHLDRNHVHPYFFNILKQEDYHIWVKKIDYSESYFHDLKFHFPNLMEIHPVKHLNDLFDFPNLMEINFYDYYNDKDIVRQLASTFSGDHYLHPSCVAHFDLSLKNNYMERLSACLSVSKKFREVTFELVFDIDDDYKDLPEEMGNDVISKCVSSLNIKVFKFILDSDPQNCILFRLINTLKLEKVLFYDRSESNTLDFENLFKLWNFSEQKDLKKVIFQITVQKLKSLYKHIPMNLVDRTSVELSVYDKEYEMDTDDFIVYEDDDEIKDIPEYNGKKFKYIDYWSIGWETDWRDLVSPEIHECLNHLRQFPRQY